MRRQVGFPCNLSIWPEHSWKSGTVHEAVGLWPQRNKTLSRKHHAARLLTAWTATWAQAGTTDSNCSSLGPSRWAKFWLFSEWITNKDVLHNTWNCTQCYWYYFVSLRLPSLWLHLSIIRPSLGVLSSKIVGNHNFNWLLFPEFQLKEDILLWTWVLASVEIVNLYWLKIHFKKKKLYRLPEFSLENVLMY